VSKSLPIEHATTFKREDGVEFEIRVTRAEGSLWGQWTCLACGGVGPAASPRAKSR
jgi:hypothetical protein